MGKDDKRGPVGAGAGKPSGASAAPVAGVKRPRKDDDFKGGAHKPKAPGNFGDKQGKKPSWGPSDPKKKRDGKAVTKEDSQVRLALAFFPGQNRPKNRTLHLAFHFFTSSARTCSRKPPFPIHSRYPVSPYNHAAPQGGQAQLAPAQRRHRPHGAAVE
jgi:hypothetical protein